MLSDAATYSKHRILQIEDTLPFVSSVIKKMDWSREDEDIGMDIGCGSGNSCLEILLPALPRVKKFFAIDIIPEMIAFAKENNSHKKIEYHVADIGDRNTLEVWLGKITKIISIHCFHWLKDQREGFNNIYHLLKPGGEAAMIIALNAKHWNSYEDQINNPKWNKYLKNADTNVPESYYLNYGASYYKTLLTNVGFSVNYCEEEEIAHILPDDETCAEEVYGIYSLSKYIPEELKEEFKKDVLKAVVKYNGRSNDSKPMFCYTILKLLLKKPL